MKKFSKRTWVMVGAVAVAAVVAVGAYAYFTAAGSGTGSFSSGQIGSVTIASDPAGPLYPQTNPANTTAVQLYVTNNGSGSQYVGALSGTIDANSLPVGCNAGWFTIAPVPAIGLVGAGQTATPTTTIILNDNNGNQNACANTTFTINWATAAG
jgi:hypothetical protein